MPMISFSEARAAVTMPAVLQLLGWVPRECKGDQLRGPCPVHRSSSPRSRSFSVNTRLGVFRCFGAHCQASGDCLQLYALVRRLPVYEATLELCHLLHLPVPELRGTVKRNCGEVQTPALWQGGAP